MAEIKLPSGKAPVVYCERHQTFSHGARPKVVINYTHDCTAGHRPRKKGRSLPGVFKFATKVFRQAIWPITDQYRHKNCDSCGSRADLQVDHKRYTFARLKDWTLKQIGCPGCIVEAKPRKKCGCISRLSRHSLRHHVAFIKALHETFRDSDYQTLCSGCHLRVTWERSKVAQWVLQSPVKIGAGVNAGIPSDASA